MKTTQYVNQSRTIATGDSGSIRDRWMQGLRLLVDPDAFTPGSSQLRPGVAAELIEAHAKRDVVLSERELQWRLRCARTYKTESEFRNAITEFPTWFELTQAGFPSFPGIDGEPPADYRTSAEIARDRARQLADLTDPQGTLFPLDQFEPIEATLKELQDYAERGEELTARFAAHDAKRRAYLEELIEAADGDLSMTWQAAHERLSGDVSTMVDTAEVSS